MAITRANATAQANAARRGSLKDLGDLLDSIIDALDSLSDTELGFVDGVTAGTVTASKAAVVDANKDISAFRNVGVVNLDAGSSGTAGSVDIFPATASKGKATFDVADQTGNTTVTHRTAEMGQATVITTPDPGAAAASVVLTEGTQTINGEKTISNLSSFATAVEAAEHGVGSIGTAVAPATYRWIENGVIITQTKIDLTGLASVADADDVIGLAAGGAAFIGRNVVANNGVIFKVELACLETPATGDNDIDLKTSSSATAAYNDDGAAFGSVFNSGDWVAGTCRQNLVPALTANDYFYLTAGTGDAGATYTAGMYVLTTYGHPVLA
jgi:hypothetical protein